MCEDQAGYSVVCGPRLSIREMIERWPSMRTAHRFSDIVEAPRLIDLVGLDRSFADPHSPAIAVIRHPKGIGIPLTRQLQVEFLVGDGDGGGSPLAQLVCEPGYSFWSTDGSGGGGSNPQIHLDSSALALIRRSLPVPTWRAAGLRVALLDTGIDPVQVPSAAHAMIDFRNNLLSGGSAVVQADDVHGHGTAMAKIIHEVNPNANITAISVLGRGTAGHCYEVLAGFEFALYSGQFDCVVACLASRASSHCDNAFGITVEWMLSYCQTQRALPLVVAAVGNDGPKHSQYLARLPGVVVGVATDSQGSDAAYNSIPPSPANTMRAYGGTQQTPVGTITATASQVEDLWGSSIAAAAIAGHLLP